MPQHRRHHFTKYGCVAMKQLEPRLARLLADARGEDDDTAASQRLIISRVNFERAGERHGMANIIRLSLRSLRVFIDQHDLAANAAQYESIGSRRPNISATDNSDLHD